VGDWIISNGTAWEKVDLTDAVSSVFGRTGAVVGVSTDYSAVGLTNTAIGAANPAAGSFTTLGSSSTTTLNGTTIPASSTLLVSGGALGAPASGTLTSCTGLPISTGVSGLGTGIATALAVNTGSAGAPVLFNGALGTPSSGTVTNLTGTASININGTVGATTPSTVAATTITAQNASFQIVAQTSGSTRMTLDHNGTNGRVGTLDAQDVFIVRANVPVAVFGSTGLNSTAIGATAASTGAFTTVSATGNLTLSAANPSLIGGTNAGSVSIQNPDAGAYISIYGSTHATKANKIEIVGTGGVTLTNGLAVTGSLSATGNVVAFSDSANGNSAFESTFSGTTRNGLDLADSTDTSGVFFGVFRKANGVAIGSITRVTTTDAVVYNTTSDGRLKENLRDFTDSGRLIDSLKPRVFDWKNSDENGKNVVGFVAQEQHAADPIFAHIGAVSVGDEDSETITKQWQRSDSALIPILVAELKSVRARLAALESN
jgi:hypothetical protein